MPIIKLSRIFTSDFGLTAHVEGEGFPANCDVQVQTYSPSGHPLSGGNKKTDSEGNFHTTIGQLSSSKIEMGYYFVYAYLGKFRYNRIDPNTVAASSNEALVKLETPYKNESLLTIDEIKIVHWGTQATIRGNLESRIIKPDGTIMYQNKAIYFTGTFVPLPVYTNESGRFHATLQIPNTIQSGCKIKAHFDGDGHFGSSSSNVVYYNIVKHDCLLNLTIDDLKLRLPSEINNGLASIECGLNYRLEGRLIDKTTNETLSLKEINFKSDPQLSLSSIRTDSTGYFKVDGLQAPNNLGRYTIKAKFQGDENYNTVESDEVTLKVLPPNLKQSYDQIELVEKLNRIRGEIIPIIARTCKTMDIEALVIKKNDGLNYYVILKVRLTRQDRITVEKIQTERKLKAPHQEKFNFVYDIRDITDIDRLLNEIEKGAVLINDINALSFGNQSQVIFSEDNMPIVDTEFTISEERENYPHKILTSQMTYNAVKYVEDEKIYYKRFSSSFDQLGYYLGIKKLNTQNNSILVLPYYCKFLDLIDEEKKSYITKIRIHDVLIPGSLVSFEMTKNHEPYLDNIPLVDFIPLKSEESGMKDFLIPKPKLEGDNSVEIRITHEIIRELATQRIWPIVQKKVSDSFLIYDNIPEVVRLTKLNISQLALEEESDCFEKKASMRHDYDHNCTNKDLEHEIAKSVASLMNGGGGLLVIGIKSFEIVGLASDFTTISNGDWDKWQQQFSAAIHNTYEIDSVFTNYYTVRKTGDDLNPVALVRVGKAPSEVWVKDKDKNGRQRTSFYVRRNNQTVRLQDRDLTNYIKTRFAKAEILDPY